MGFNIGGLLSGLAPVIGAAFGPTGAIIGGQVGGIITAAAGAPSVAPRVRANGAMVPQEAIVGVAPRVPVAPSTAVAPMVTGGALVPLATGARGLIAALLAKAGLTLGKRVTANGVLALVREIGLAAAAAALGLELVEIAQIIAAKPRRRRRGITAAQLATIRKTLRKVATINRTLAEFRPPVRRATGRRVTQTRISN